MAGLILIGMIVVMLLVLFVQMLRKKPLKKLLLSYGVILGGYYLYVTYTCGPNRADVKVMKPQAEAITAYILKDGIPETLADIPNLSYQWGQCKMTSKNIELCHFKKNNTLYRTKIDHLFCILDIYNEKSETGVFVNFEKLNDGTWRVSKKLTPYSTKNDGICNPMKM